MFNHTTPTNIPCPKCKKGRLQKITKPINVHGIQCDLCNTEFQNLPIQINPFYEIILDRMNAGQDIFRRPTVDVLIQIIDELSSKLQGCQAPAKPFIYIFKGETGIAKVTNQDGELLDSHVINLDSVYDDICPICGDDEFTKAPCRKCGYNPLENNGVQSANRFYKRGGETQPNH